MAGIHSLPIELLLDICDLLSPTEIIRWASTQKHFHRVCLQRAFKTPESRDEVFLWACEKGFPETVSQALAAGTPVDHISTEHLLPLYTFDWRREAGANVDLGYGTQLRLNRSGTALAISNGHVEVLKLLQKEGANLQNALRIYRSSSQCVEDSNTIQKQKTFHLSPFHLVRHEHMFQALLKAGHKVASSLPKKVNKLTRSQLPASIISWMVLREANPSVIQMAINDGGHEWDGNTRDVQPLVLACQKGDIDTVSALLKAGASATHGVTWRKRPRRRQAPHRREQFRLVGYNSAVWYSFASVQYGPWEQKSHERWCKLLDMFTAHGLDLNTNATWTDREPSLSHLSMLPHVGADTVQKLIDLKADPTRKAAFDCEDFLIHLYKGRPDYTIRWPGGPRPEAIRVAGDMEVTALESLMKPCCPTLEAPVTSSALRCPALYTQFELNQRRKFPILLKSLMSKDPTFVTETLKWAKATSSTDPERCDYIWDLGPMILLSALGTLEDLREPKWKAYLQEMEHSREIQKGTKIVAGTLDNVTHWVETLAHHRIFSPPLDADGDDSAVSWACRGSIDTPRPGVVRDCPNYRKYSCEEANCDDFGWSDCAATIDMELNLVEQWHQLLSDSRTGKHNTAACTFPYVAPLTHTECCLLSLWEKFKKDFKVNERRRDNTRRILRACFQLDLDVDHPIYQENIEGEERWLEAWGFLEEFREEVAARKSRALAYDREAAYQLRKQVDPDLKRNPYWDGWIGIEFD